MKKLIALIALVVGMSAANLTPAFGYWDCVEYEHYTECNWYEDEPSPPEPYWCWDPMACTYCNPCWA